MCNELQNLRDHSADRAIICEADPALVCSVPSRYIVLLDWLVGGSTFSVMHPVN